MNDDGFPVWTCKAMRPAKTFFVMCLPPQNAAAPPMKKKSVCNRHPIFMSSGSFILILCMAPMYMDTIPNRCTMVHHLSASEGAQQALLRFFSL